MVGGAGPCSKSLGNSGRFRGFPPAGVIFMSIERSIIARLSAGFVLVFISGKLQTAADISHERSNGNPFTFFKDSAPDDGVDSSHRYYWGGAYLGDGVAS